MLGVRLGGPATVPPTERVDEFPQSHYSLPVPQQCSVSDPPLSPGISVLASTHGPDLRIFRSTSVRLLQGSRRDQKIKRS